MESEDFLLELFEKINVLPMNQAVKEALQVLDEIRKKGSPEDANQAAKRAIDLLWQNSERFVESKSLKMCSSHNKPKGQAAAILTCKTT